MQYILTEQELNGLISKDVLKSESEKVIILLDQFKKHIGCSKRDGGYCDDCSIASLNSHSKICGYENYSK